MVRISHGWMACMIGGVLCGCASTREPPSSLRTQGDVSYHLVDSPDTKHYSLALGEVARGATLQANPAPIDPPELLPTQLPPVRLQAKLIVDANGHVSEVRIDETTDPTRKRFAEAVREAASHWEFSPLMIDHWAADANGDSHLVDGNARPFSFDYVFGFEVHDGKPHVSSTAAQAH